MKKIIFCVLAFLNGDVLGSVFTTVPNGLDKLAIKHGTDKGPTGCPRILPSGRKMEEHNYTPYYNFYFAHLRDKKIKVLEIGFLHGSSARMWREYFPQAEVHFIDNDPQAFQKYGKDLAAQCHFHVLDQGNKKSLIDFVKKTGGEFDIIVDDGGHTMTQQIESFVALFPALKSGGIYAIEDMHSSYVKYYGGHGTRENPKADAGTAICFLFDLVHELNYFAARTGCADINKCSDKIFKNLNYYQKNIEAIHFFPSLGFILKR